MPASVVLTLQAVGSPLQPPSVEVAISGKFSLCLQLGEQHTSPLGLPFRVQWPLKSNDKEQELFLMVISYPLDLGVCLQVPSACLSMRWVIQELTYAWLAICPEYYRQLQNLCSHEG